MSGRAGRRQTFCSVRSNPMKWSTTSSYVRGDIIEIDDGDDAEDVEGVEDVARSETDTLGIHLLVYALSFDVEYKEEMRTYHFAISPPLPTHSQPSLPK